jgi:hypothetical protein
MDDLTVMQSFRAERDVEPPEAREAVWRALEAHMEAAATEARGFGEVLAGSIAPARAPSRRRGLLSRRRRRLLALSAAATAAAVVTAGALVFSSGPTAQPAAAEILHQAAAAVSGRPATYVPGPGQFLYAKVVRTEVHNWLYPLPPSSADVPVGGTGGTMKGPHAFNALVPVTVESWTASNGGGRSREVAGTPQFWNSEEEARWQAAGSPLPPPFNAEYQQRYKGAFKGANEIGPRVVDMSHQGWGSLHLPDTSKLPTEAKALRQQVEANEIEVSGFNLMFGTAPRHLDHEQTAEELFNVLQEGRATPQLQAAIFNALAELPEIKVETEATDGAGRSGAAIRTGTKDGVQTEYLFDPEGGELFAQRSILVDPAADRSLRGIPAGTVISERDLLEVATVDSTSETGGEAEGKGPVATTGPAYRK